MRMCGSSISWCGNTLYDENMPWNYVGNKSPTYNLVCGNIIEYTIL